VRVRVPHSGQVVEEVFIHASTSSTDEERAEFKKAMTNFIPSF
jgi:hypothetical protein